jgi:hypothetical protein
MRFYKVTLRSLAVVMTLSLFCFSIALAKKPSGTGGGGGGGGGAGYNLVVLAPLGTNTYTSTVGDINENGKIVGSFADVKNNTQPFYYDVVTQKYTALEYTTLSRTRALGINNASNIVGVDWDVGQALYWNSPTADPVALPPLPNDTEAIASGINDTRMVCGRSFDDSFYWRGVAWQIDASGNVESQVELPSLVGDDIAVVFQISEVDADGIALVTGYSGIQDQEFTSETAVLWEVGLDNDGVLQLLAGPVGLGTIAGGYSLGYSVNTLGDVCGESENWPFLALEGQTAQALPGLDNSDVGIALDLNENGQIVGKLQVWSKRSPGFRAVLWENGEAVDLSKRVSLGRSERIEDAGKVNNTGLITGNGTFPDFESEGGAYLLIPK